MILKQYQEEAIAKLKCAFKSCFNSNSNNICVFQAPTGSGKTITCANLLKIIVQEKISPKPLSFIWISVRKLHTQSKDKLTKIYQDSQILECSEFDDLQENQIQENEIWFVNWESINRINDSIIIKENEAEKYLEKILENTRQEGRDIVLIIDESHYAAQADRSLELIKMINPKITLEVSATPGQKENCAAFVKTKIDDVKKEEMIKNEVLINPKINEEYVDGDSATHVVIEQSIKKQDQLRKMYENEGSSINPLIIVQLPDSRSGIQDKVEEIVSEFTQFGKTVDKNNLAIWFSNNKTPNLLDIEKNDSHVDVLIFKQAIALGWDCPRAAILVIFRQTKSLDFTIQVIGRIMRMPEQKHYFKHPELNQGYIFTNLQDIKLADEYVKNYAKQFHLERNEEIYDHVTLPSTYLKRQRERTRLSGKIVKLFEIAAQEKTLKENIDPDVKKIVRPIIVDGKIVNIDEDESISIGGSLNTSISEVEIQRLFDLFVLDSCKPFAPFDSSDRLKIALYNWIYQNLGIEKLSTTAQIIVLSEKNIEKFFSSIQLAKEKYKKNIIDNVSNVRDHLNTEKWEIPLMQSLSNPDITDLKKSIMNPTVAQTASNLEREFIKKIDESNKVKWWYKNGQREIKYFAVPYIDEFGLEWSFYVDFIIKFHDGTIGLFDTKIGDTAKKAKHKAEALTKYIHNNSTKTRSLIGGIITSSEFGWKYNDNEVYEYNPNDLSDWKNMDF